VPAVYVELCAGCTATEAELLEHARSRIPEQAAVPRHLEILPELPKTAVGKIFKPDLRRSAITRVYNESLAAAGVSARVVEVIEDKKRGLVAMVDGPRDETVTVILGEFVTPWQWRE